MDKEKKNRALRARLIAAGISALMLAAAMGVTFWMSARYKAAYLPFDLTKMTVINCAGALLLYLIVCHFLKKDKE